MPSRRCNRLAEAEKAEQRENDDHDQNDPEDCHVGLLSDDLGGTRRACG